MPQGYTVEEAKKAIDSVAEGFEAFKKANDQRLEEIKANGKASAETEAKIAKIEKQVEKQQAIKERLDQIEAFVKRSGPAQEDSKGRRLSEDEVAHKEAVMNYIRKGVGESDGSLSKLEEKALAVQSDPDGGYFVPADTSGRIVKRIYETSPIRQLANVITISTDSLEGMYDTEEAEGEWVGETDTRDNGVTPKLGKWSVPVHELATRPRATQKLLDDSAVNIESWLQNKVARKFSRKENAAFISGNGVAKPTGILHYPDASDIDAYEIGKIGTAESAASGVVTFDDLIDFFDGLKDEFMVNATLAANRRSWSTLRKLKDSQGQYLWQPSVQVGDPATILGVGLASFNDLPAADAGVQGAFVLADFREAYQIVDRQGIRVLRDPYTVKPYVEFYTTKRVGGAVVNFDAIKRLNIAA